MNCHFWHYSRNLLMRELKQTDTLLIQLENNVKNAFLGISTCHKSSQGLNMQSFACLCC